MAWGCANHEYSHCHAIALTDDSNCRSRVHLADGRRPARKHRASHAYSLQENEGGRGSPTPTACRRRVGESAVGVPRLQSAGKGALERAHDYDSRSTTREGTQRRAGDATAAAVIEECAAKSIWQHNTKVGSQSTGSTQIGPSCCSCSVHASRHAKKRDHPTFPECCVLPRFKMSKQRDLGIPSCHFLVFKRYWGRPSPDARLCILGPRRHCRTGRPQSFLDEPWLSMRPRLASRSSS